MNTSNKKSLSELIQVMKEESISQGLSEDAVVGNPLESQENVGVTTATAASVVYKQECVFSIIRDFSPIIYNIDFTSANINQSICRRLMKFILAIAISEEENIITEESVETTLKTLDIPVFFEFALNNILGLFRSFVNKVVAANTSLYLIDARSRWRPDVLRRENMSCGEIPCEFSVTPSTLEGQPVSEVYLSFFMLGRRYQLWAEMSNSQVYNMRLMVSYI